MRTSGFAALAVLILLIAATVLVFISSGARHEVANESPLAFTFRR